MTEVDVVVGIIRRGDKILVQRRREDEKVDPSIVCLPGGHVRKHENLTDALKREMIEELGIEVSRIRFICRNQYVASNGEKQNAYCFLIEEYTGEPVCKSAQEIYWEGDVENLSLEVDKKTLTKLKEFEER